MAGDVGLEFSDAAFLPLLARQLAARGADGIESEGQPPLDAKRRRRHDTNDAEGV